MKTFAEEVAGVLSSDPMPLAAIARELGADLSSVRRASQTLNAAGMAILVRRGRSLLLASLKFKGLACKACYVEFERRPKSKRRCCSRACGIAWSWTRPGVREKRIAGILIQKATPEAKAMQVEHNKRRWSKPGEREKLSEQNRREWADPKKAAKRAAGIRAAHGSAEHRKMYSDYRKADWQKPGYRERASASMREVKNRPEVKAKFSANLKARWQNPKTRPAFMAAVKRNGQKAIERLKGYQQTPEHIQKRIDTIRRNKLIRASERGVS